MTREKEGWEKLMSMTYGVPYFHPAYSFDQWKKIVEDEKLNINEEIYYSNGIDSAWTFPLFAALCCRYGNGSALARYLIENGADINQRVSGGKFDGQSLLTPANTVTARLLLDLGFDVNRKDNKRRTPLHALFLENKSSDDLHEFETAQLLVKAGADVNSTDVDGLTPLHYACKSCARNSVCFLLENGAVLDQEAKNKLLKDVLEARRKALDLSNRAVGEDKYRSACAKANGFEAIAGLLLSHGAEPDYTLCTYDGRALITQKEAKECIDSGKGLSISLRKRITRQEETKKHAEELKKPALEKYETDWSKLEEDYGIGLHEYLEETGVELPESGVYIEKNKHGVVTLMVAVQDHKPFGPYERYDDRGELIEKGKYDEENRLDGTITLYKVAKVGREGRDVTGDYEARDWEDMRTERYEALSISLKHGLPDGRFILRKPVTSSSYRTIWAGSDSIGCSSTEVKTVVDREYKDGKIWTDRDCVDFQWENQKIYIRNGKAKTEGELAEEAYQSDLKSIKQHIERVRQEKAAEEQRKIQAFTEKALCQ